MGDKVRLNLKDKLIIKLLLSNEKQQKLYLEPIVSKINLRKITLRRINSGGIDVFALHFNW